MQSSRQIKPVGFRPPDDLRQWLKDRAVRAGRSVNSELNIILASLREQEQRQQQN